MPTLTPAEVRALFPAAQRVCYLNGAASSPIALPVETAINEHYREASTFGDVGFEGWLARRLSIRDRFARFIGAGTDEVAFVGSTSLGFHFVGQYLLQRGVKEVVTLEGEFPSTTLPLLHLGLRLRVVKARSDGSYANEDIEAAVRGGGRNPVGALAISAVQYASGFRADLTTLGALCRAEGLVFAVNGAQALGQIPIDVAASGIDFLCGTSHKWLMGGFGVGVFYARSAVVQQGALPMASWLSVANPMSMDNLAGATLRDVEGQPWFSAEGARFLNQTPSLEVGTSAFGLVFGFGAALALHEGVGITTTEAHNRALQSQLRAGLRQRGFSPNAPDDRIAGICVFPVEGDAHAAVGALAKAGVVVTPRGVGIRASTHIFNNGDDVERFLWAVDEVGLRPAR